jgi:hypothetical protein
MAKGRGKSKGNSFEREICKALSLWWTEGKRDDVFWRSQNSGGRATSRKKGGKHTAGQFGDVSATESLAEPLTQFFTIELKRGYPDTNAQSVLDNPMGNKPNDLESFLMQAGRDAELAETPGGFLLISKRDRKEILIWQTLESWQELVAYTGEPMPVPFLTLALENRTFPDVIGLRFYDWTEIVNPTLIKNALKRRPA